MRKHDNRVSYFRIELLRVSFGMKELLNDGLVSIFKVITNPLNK